MHGFSFFASSSIFLVLYHLQKNNNFETFSLIVAGFEKARGYQIERENYIADIMGIAPRPPDIGRNTVIKPITGKYLPNKRSPLAEDEDEYVNQSVIRDRFNRSNTRNSRRRKDSNSSGTSFDYKYDY